MPDDAPRPADDRSARVPPAPAPQADRAARTERFDLHALYETSRLLGGSLELDFVLDNLLLTTLSKLLVMRGAVLLWRPAEGGYRVAATKGGLDGLREGTVLSLGEDPAAAPFSDGSPAQGDAVPRPLRERGVALALPLRRKGKRLGLLALGPKGTGAPFRAPEIEFVASLAAMSAAAVENALLVEELRQANHDLDGKVQELNTLFDLSQEMGATLDEERLGKLLSFALMGQMAVRRHLFLLRESGTGEDGVPHPFQSVVARGAPVEVTPALTEAICGRRRLVRLDDAPAGGANGASWEALREAGLAVVLPIRHQEETCAALALGPKLTGRPYEAGDIEFLYSLGNLALTSLQNARLVEQRVEMERLEQEIALARDAQQRLLPQALPAAEGASIAARTVPSREVGGDYYDAITLPPGDDEAGERLLLAVADVTGKGVPASLLMANLQAALQALAPADLPLDELAARLNRVVCRNTDMGTFITLFAAVYDPAARTLDYVNAGHNPPMLLHAGSDGPDGAPELLDTGGLLLGVMSGASYECGQVQLAPGDTLAIFTDGATEAMTPAGEEFGRARLAASLRAHSPSGDPEAVLDAVFEDVRAFAGHPPHLSDDLTMIVLSVSS